jgi:hypothetical protein
MCFGVSSAIEIVAGLRSSSPDWMANWVAAALEGEFVIPGSDASEVLQFGVIAESVPKRTLVRRRRMSKNDEDQSEATTWIISDFSEEEAMAMRSA